MAQSKRVLFYQIYVVFVCALTALIMYVPKGHEVIYLSDHQNVFFTQIFKWSSFLGEGFTIVFISIYLIFKNKDLVKYWALAFFIQLGLTQGIKNLLKAPRPFLFFPEGTLAPIKDVPILLHNSMPSGHTSSAFLIVSFIIFFLLKETKQLIIFLTLSAIMVGFSRIYLLAHFKEDVLVGSAIGVMSSEIAYYFYSSKLKRN